MFFVLGKPGIVVLLLPVYLEQLGFQVGNQGIVVRNELPCVQGEHVVLGIDIYSDGIFFSNCVIILIAVAVTGENYMDVLSPDYHRIECVSSIAVAVQ